jgi:hypothetical protein
VTPRPGALASLRPQFRLPPAARPAMALAAPVLVASWALIGFYGSLGPALIRRLLDSRSLTLGGVTLFVLGASAALTVLATRSRPARAVMALGATVLAAGVAVTLSAISNGSAVVFFAGAVLSGAGFGAGMQGAIRTVLPLATAHERAGVLSVLYVVSYLAMGVPAVLGGVRVVHGGGLLTGAREYGAAVIALAALAVLGSLVRRTDRAAAPALAR